MYESSIDYQPQSKAPSKQGAPPTSGTVLYRQPHTCLATMLRAFRMLNLASYRYLGCAGAVGPGSKAISNQALAGLLVGLIAAVILGVVVVVFVALRLRRRNRDLLGRVRAPRAGVDTTLLISGKRVPKVVSYTTERGWSPMHRHD